MSQSPADVRSEHERLIPTRHVRQIASDGAPRFHLHLGTHLAGVVQQPAGVRRQDGLGAGVVGGAEIVSVDGGNAVKREVGGRQGVAEVRLDVDPSLGGVVQVDVEDRGGGGDDVGGAFHGAGGVARRGPLFLFFRHR